jgi:hypothetical protein
MKALLPLLLFLLFHAVFALKGGPRVRSEELVALRVEQASVCSPQPLMVLINATVDVLIEPGARLNGQDVGNYTRASEVSGFVAQFVAYFAQYIRMRESVCPAYALASTATLNLFSNGYYLPRTLDEYDTHCRQVLNATDNEYLRSAAAWPKDRRLPHTDPYVQCMAVGIGAESRILPSGLKGEKKK